MESIEWIARKMLDNCLVMLPGNGTDLMDDSSSDLFVSSSSFPLPLPPPPQILALTLLPDDPEASSNVGGNNDLIDLNTMIEGQVEDPDQDEYHDVSNGNLPDSEFGSHESEAKSKTSWLFGSISGSDVDLRVPTPDDSSIRPEPQGQSQGQGQQRSQFRTTGDSVDLEFDIKDLPTAAMTRILSYLNSSDLLHSRLVSKKWFVTICESEVFLKSILFQVTARSEMIHIAAESQVKWHNICILYLDIKDPDQSREEGEWMWKTGQNFLQSAKFLEFRCCTLSWNLVKHIMTWTPDLEQLSFARCTFVDFDFGPNNGPGKNPAETAENQHQKYLTAWRNLKILTVEDVGSVDRMANLLIHVVSLNLSSLERLDVLFDSSSSNSKPNSNSSSSTNTTANTNTSHSSNESMSMSALVSEDSAEILHFQVLQLMYQNRKTLKCLFLNLRDKTLVNTFCAQVLDNFHSTLKNLEEFQLTPFIPGYENETPIDITSETNAPMVSLTNFFNRHTTLRNVSFPHFNNRLSTELRRRKIVRSLPKTVEKLHLPGYSYLVPDFLNHLPNLKYIFIGNSVPGRPFHPNAYRYTPTVCNNIEAVGINTKIHLRPGKLSNFAWKFPALTRLEFDALKAVVNDRDFQGIICNCRWLRHLSIHGCDMISDFGVTGTSKELCKDIFRLGIIYTNPPKEIPVQGKYKPLSSLQGLRTLLLRGNAQITDVGLYYAFRFQEVKTIWVPFSERITAWGIKKIGLMNPSLENFVVTAVQASSSVQAIQELTTEHPRMSLENVHIMEVIDETPSMMSRPTMLTAILPDNWPSLQQ